MYNLTYTFLNRAFRILRRNYGCPGNDRLSIKEIKKSYKYYIEKLTQQIDNKSYKFEAHPKFITIYDSCKSGRRIFIYNVLERWVQHYIKLHIDPLINLVLSEYVYAYRRGKTDIESYDYILKNKPEYVLRLDIENFFESIDKNYLFELLKEIGVHKDLIKLIKNSYSHHKIGLPAGHVLSCTLSNLYLKNFDYKFPHNYTRYSDDMMFALNSRYDVENSIKLVEHLLDEYNFKLNHNKTKVFVKPTMELLK